MARLAHKRVDTAVCPESATSSAESFVNLHMAHDKVFGIDTAQFSVTFGVLEKHEKELG